MMKPKYITAVAMISFDSVPADEDLMISVQEAWFGITGRFHNIDPESGELSVPIITNDDKIVYAYTMKTIDGSELEPSYIRDTY
jgi:hypothetical protein